MDGKSVSSPPSSLLEKKEQTNERFMWSNVCKKSKSPQQQEQGKQLPLSKLFVSGTKHHVEDRQQTKRLRMTEITDLGLKLQENINQSNSQDNSRTSHSHKSTPPVDLSEPQTHQILQEDLQIFHPRLDPKKETNQSSTTTAKSLGCWTFNIRKRKRLSWVCPFCSSSVGSTSL
jgi:hypothetical protein